MVDYALPFALFLYTAKMQRASLADHLALIVVLIAVMLLPYFASLPVSRFVFRTDLTHTVRAVTIGMPNLASVGLPPLRAVYGPDSDLSVAIAVTTAAVVMSPAALVLLERAQSSTGVAGAQAVRGRDGLVLAALCNPMQYVREAGRARTAARFCRIARGLEPADAADVVAEHHRQNDSGACVVFDGARPRSPAVEARRAGLVWRAFEQYRPAAACICTRQPARVTSNRGGAGSIARGDSEWLFRHFVRFAVRRKRRVSGLDAGCLGPAVGRNTERRDPRLRASVDGGVASPFFPTWQACQMCWRQVRASARALPYREPA